MLKDVSCDYMLVVLFDAWPCSDHLKRVQMIESVEG